MSFRGYYHILYHFTHVLCLLKTRRFIQCMQSPMFWFALVSFIILYRTLVTCCLFLWCQVEPVSTEPRCWRSDPPEWIGSKAQIKPGMDQSMAMSTNCNLMIELYIRYYVYVCEALVTWFCKMCCIYMLWLVINIFWIWIWNLNCFLIRNKSMHKTTLQWYPDPFVHIRDTVPKSKV